MNPYLLSMLLNMGAQGLTALTTKEQAPQNVNPYTDDIMAQLQALLAQYQSGQTSGLADAQRYEQQAAQTAQDMKNIQNQMANVDVPDQSAWYRNFLQQIPGYEQIAQNAASEAFKTLGRTVEQQTQAATTEAVNQAMSQFSGGQAYSGAAQQAIGKAATEAALPIQANLQGQQASMQGNIFNQLAGQGQGLAFQANQNEFTNALDALNQQLQAANLQGQQFQGLAGLGINRANVNSSTINNLLAQLGSYGAPQMQLPTYTSPMESLIPMAETFGAYATNPDYTSLLTDFFQENSARPTSDAGFLQFLQNLFSGNTDVSGLSGSLPSYQSGNSIIGAY